MTTERYMGKYIDETINNPATSGAKIPASRLSADAIPHAVPRIEGGKTSGVYPVRSEFVHPNKHLTRSGSTIIRFYASQEKIEAYRR